VLPLFPALLLDIHGGVALSVRGVVATGFCVLSEVFAQLAAALGARPRPGRRQGGPGDALRPLQVRRTRVRTHQPAARAAADPRTRWRAAAPPPRDGQGRAVRGGWRAARRGPACVCRALRRGGRRCSGGCGDCVGGSGRPPSCGGERDDCGQRPAAFVRRGARRLRARTSPLLSACRASLAAERGCHCVCRGARRASALRRALAAAGDDAARARRRGDRTFHSIKNRYVQSAPRSLDPQSLDPKMRLHVSRRRPRDGRPPHSERRRAQKSPRGARGRGGLKARKSARKRQPRALVRDRRHKRAARKRVLENDAQARRRTESCVPHLLSPYCARERCVGRVVLGG
jgi:hypothetical protein